MLLLALLSLIVPGLLIGRVLRIPFAWSAAFPLSALLLAETIVAYSIAGIPIRLTTVLTTVGVVTVVASLVLALRPRVDRSEPSAPDTANQAPRWLIVGSVMLAVAVGLGILLRNTKYPLSGFDTLFRWEGLAQLVLEHESLDFYPPRTAEDFEKYVYPDGLPPLTAGVYWWLYAGMKKPFPPLTSIVIALQFASILALTFFAAKELIGTTGAYAALAALASSSLLITGVAIGQETGYTALSVAGQICFALAATREPRAALVIVTACFAALGALAREYGLALAIAGLLVLAWQPQTRRWLPLFCVAALVLTAPWYVRNWHLTGNPVYSNDVAGVFPVNPAHAGLLGTYKEFFGLQNLTTSDWFAVLRRLVSHSPLPMLIGIPAMLVGWKRFWPLIGVTLVTVLLWLWSIPYTGGGLAYSMRVLTPAWVALSIAAGAAGVAILERFKSRGALARSIMPLALALCGAYAIGHAFAHPFESSQLPSAFMAQRPDPLNDWPTQLEAAELLEASELPPCGVLTDDNYLAVALQRRSKFRPVTLWSPEVEFVLDADLPPSEIRRRLREKNILLVSVTTETYDSQFSSQLPFYRDDSAAWQPVVAVPGNRSIIVSYLPAVEPSVDPE